MSNFPFVDDRILQNNLDLAFVHVVDLLALSESQSYENKKTLVSSLRKTIIIHTASIIEALLLWKFRNVCNGKSVVLIDEWKYLNIRVIYPISDYEEVISGFRMKEERNLSKLDFVRVTDLCFKYKIVKSAKLKIEIDNVRELRNRLHLGGLAEMEREYSKNDLEFCFSVAKKVKKLVAK